MWLRELGRARRAAAVRDGRGNAAETPAVTWPPQAKEDGFELAEHVREPDKQTKCPHLFALTGYGQDADKDRSKRAGFERHLTKPVEIDTVSNVMAALVV